MHTAEPHIIVIVMGASAPTAIHNKVLELMATVIDDDGLIVGLRLRFLALISHACCDRSRLRMQQNVTLFVFQCLRAPPSG
jgi:hypothetical protein